jgi:hypothetical protein
MQSQLTRRGALGGAAAVVLASCGGADPPAPGEPPAGSGVATLNSLLALEHAAAAAWKAIGAQLRGDARRYGRRIEARESDHAARLSDLVSELGGEPAAGREPGGYDESFPLMREASDALRFAGDLEEELVRTHLDALRTLTDERQRRLVATIVAQEAEDLAVVHVLAGDPAAPQPFVTGTL